MLNHRIFVCALGMFCLLAACQGGRSGTPAIDGAMDSSPFSASVEGSGTGGVTDSLKDLSGKLGELSGNGADQGAIDGAIDALAQLENALNGVAGSDLAVALAALKGVVPGTEAVCRAAAKLTSPALKPYAIALFTLCDRKWVYEVRCRLENFFRDTQTDSPEEVARLIGKWKYQGFKIAYSVLKSPKAYANEPAELAQFHFPKVVVPLYRCWQAEANYYFMTTDGNCEGAPQMANPPDPMGIRRTIGYVSPRAVAGNGVALQRYRKLAIPNDLAAVNRARKQSLVGEGYESLGVLGYVGF